MSSPEVLKELVAIPSITGQEAAIAAYVANQCEVYGHSVQIVGDSVAVHIPGSNSENAFVLNGHLDTIPVVEGWQTDPFDLTQAPGDADMLIGLGASDMKAGIGLMLDMAAETKRGRPPCDVWLLFTSREEVDNEGARQLTAWFAGEHKSQYQTIGGLILEPTVEHGDTPFVGVGHRNGLILEVTAEGVGGHGSQQINDGETAIEKLSTFIAVGLPAIRAEWNARYGHEVLGGPIINPTDYQAGIGKHNIIPAMGKVIFDMRTTPALDEALTEEIVRLQHEYGVSIVSPWSPSNTLCPLDAPICQTMRQVVPDAAHRAFPASTDLFAFLEHDLHMVIYGPGEIEAMHQPNEWVRRTAIDKCGKDIGAALRRFAAINIEQSSAG